jgi:transposase
MDNVAFHHSAETLRTVADKGFVPLFIPPYSPRVNAIENIFGVLKNKYRKRCPVHVDMAMNYKRIMQDVLNEGMNCKPFFQRVDSFVAVCGYDV